MSNKQENRRVLLRIENLKMHFPIKKKSFFQKERKYVHAVDGVTLDIFEGETLGLVGESGCGKSTLGRVILQLYKQSAGSVFYDALTVDERAPRYLRKVLRKMAHLQGTPDVDSLLKKHKDCLQLAGGLLAHPDRGKVVSALTGQYLAVARQNQVEDKIRLTDMRINSLKEGKDTGTVRLLIGQNEAKLQKLQHSLQTLTAETAVHSAALQDLQRASEKCPGYKELEMHVDHGVNLARLTREEMRHLRCDLQMVFQDPYSSLNPRHTVGQLIAEALVAHNFYKRGTKQMENYTLNIMDKCGLQAYMLHRYPHQFSGGQRQRIGIARSLALQPKFVVCDEAVSALDVSIQSQIINLLVDLKERDGLTYFFISHDLSAVKFISDRIGVMYLGNLIELGSSATIFEETLHPYTEALIGSIPTTEDEANRELKVLEGDIPSSIDPPSGCKFHTRCKYAQECCSTQQPEWRELRPNHYVACHFPLIEQNN